MIDLNFLIYIGIFICIFILLSKGTIINIGGTVNYSSKEDERLQDKAKEKLDDTIKKNPR